MGVYLSTKKSRMVYSARLDAYSYACPCTGVHVCRYTCLIACEAAQGVLGGGWEYTVFCPCTTSDFTGLFGLFMGDEAKRVMKQAAAHKSTHKSKHISTHMSTHVSKHLSTQIWAHMCGETGGCVDRTQPARRRARLVEHLHIHDVLEQGGWRRSGKYQTGMLLANTRLGMLLGSTGKY